METRNFYILIASACIGMTAFWLSMYNFALYDIDPIKYAQDQIEEITEGNELIEGEIVLTIKGDGVKDDLELSLEELKSDKYNQIKDQVFHFKNRVGREWTDEYSGPTLWSILELNDILKSSAVGVTFIGEDHYAPPYDLNIEEIEEYEELIIIAYEENGYPIYDDGPVMSIVDQSAIPDLYSSQYAVKELTWVEID